MDERILIALIGLSSLTIGLAMVPVYFTLLKSPSWLDALGKLSMMILLTGCAANVAMACHGISLGDSATCSYLRLQQLCSTVTFCGGGGLYALWRGIWNARQLNAFSFGFHFRRIVK